MAWTNEQLKAITESGKNIIVSAGAGSGKTAVLSERVIDKVKNNIHVNELLILTFTKAAASEMKDRIRKKLSDYKDELNLLNSSYITTFDSYALSIVKKYHYLLNVPSDIGISDESIILLEKKRILDELFEEYYLKKDKDFLNLIDVYCVKNDNYLRENILKISNIIDNRFDKIEYIDFIKNTFFSDEYINKIIEKYYDFLEDKRKSVLMEFENLNYYFDSKTVDKIYDSISNILNSNIRDLYLINSVSLPRISKYPNEEAKKIKENLKKSIDEIISYSKYGNSDSIRYSIVENKSVVLTILDIVSKFIKRVSDYKSENNIYTFNDIACMSIDILKNNENIRNEIKNSFKEIMIDEYQDTNDIQDAFISLIENNNVYMVGDIKQSIYKFRGSNPNIFKSKYDKYSLNDGGYKIDLIKNFRSRSEVLDNINRIFELLMDDDLGGAKYKESHEMNYGNTLYDDNRMKDYDYNFKVLEYEKSNDYSNIEIEMFTIANDIKNKINSKLKVFDKDKKYLRDIKYSDFVIILDRSKYFTDFKKVFEYSGIPLNVLKDEKLNDSSDILLIKNIFDFIIRINKCDYGIDFKYDFMSIGRSFLYEYSDEYLFSIFKNNTFKETELFKDFSKIDSINSKSIVELFDDILDMTSFYSKIYKVGEYENINVRLKSLSDIAESLNDLGMTISDFVTYLDNLNKESIDIKYNAYNTSNDSVKIMTIHKSKGLEFPICYFADLDHSFNMSDTKDLFIVSSDYGLIVPNTLSEEETSILKKLYINDYTKEEISEKIRLFYVALTRAREQMIIVLPKKETMKLEKDENGVLNKIRRFSFLKLSDFIYGIKDYLNEYFYDIDIYNIGLNKSYLYIKKIDNILNDSNDDFVVDEININNEVNKTNHFSKESHSLLDSITLNNMKYGTKIHETFEYIDFKNYDDSIIKDKFIRNKVNSFVNCDIMKNVKNATIYHEYEFMYQEDGNIYHGIIDLMLEYSDHIDIVDFKLKNTKDENYLKQLDGYKKYIGSISNKKINTYLYSILDEKTVLQEIM